MSSAAAEHFVKLIAVTFFDRGDFRSPDLGLVIGTGLETHLQTEAKEDAFDPIVLSSLGGFVARRRLRLPLPGA